MHSMVGRVIAVGFAGAVVALVSGCLNTGRYGPSETGDSSRYAYAPAAIGIGLAGAALSRGSGGCFSVCAYGTVCDPDTGECVSAPEAEGPATESFATPVPFDDPAYGTLDTETHTDERTTPQPDPVTIRRPVDLPDAVDPCARLCRLDEVCERYGDEAVACVPKGPLPGST